MRPIEFEVCLDSSRGDAPYSPGQLVAGKIRIELLKRKKIKGIKLRLEGKGKTSWQEPLGKTTTTATETEQYIHETVVIFGYDDANPEVWLEEGLSEYPFYFNLPMGLPSSFEMKHGSVRYYLEALISRSSALKIDHKTRTEFRVNGILDLNKEPEAGYIAEIDKMKHLGYFCVSSGSIGFNLQVPKSGFVPGERIPVSLQIFNNSQRAATKVKIEFVQKITLHAKTKRKSETNTISTVNGPRVSAGESEVWEINLLDLPSVPPTGLGGSRIIDLEYFVKVEIDIPGSLNLTGKVRLIVGTVPLRRSSQNSDWNVSPIHQDELASASRVTFPMTRLFISPPPSYEEAVGISYIPRMQRSILENGDNSLVDSQPPAYGNLENNMEYGAGRS